jgi:butyrate kinase
MQSDSASECVLVINPGSTSTKLAVYTRQGSVDEAVISHDSNKLTQFSKIIDQLDLRFDQLMKWVRPYENSHWVAVVGRGGLLAPLEGGTYIINDEMLDDLKEARFSAHASNLGALMARKFADPRKLPAFVVDPVTVDNFPPIARISGVPEIQRRCRAHALNIKAVARDVAGELGKSLEKSRFVVAHLGGGISVCALDGGKIVDVNDALLGMGPFSPERAGALPIGPLVELAFSGKFGQQSLLKKLSRNSGMIAYLGTNDLRLVEDRIKQGDHEASLIFSAMAYQVAKEIGAMAMVLSGDIDGVILTGGMMHSDMLFEELQPRIAFLEPIFRRAGEKEMEALAQGAFRVVDGEEKAREYRSSSRYSHS